MVCGIALHSELLQQFKDNKILLAEKLGRNVISDEQYMDVALTVLDTILNLDDGDNVVIDTKNNGTILFRLPMLQPEGI